MKTSKKRSKAAKKKEDDAWERKIRAQALSESGYSMEDISEALGVSKGVVRNLLAKGEADD